MSTVSKLIEIALAEEGYLEKNSNENLDDKTANAGKKNYTKYARDLDKVKSFYNGRKQSFSWCDVFVDWCFVQAFGVERGQQLLCQPDKSTGAGVGFSKSFYEKKKQYHKKNPKVGDQIFFKRGNKMTHTGLVYKVDNLQVYTVEGNTSSAKGVVSNGGCVRLKSYKLTSSSIDGYGRPAYTAEELGTSNTSIEKTIMFVDNVGYDGLNVRSLKDDSIVDNIPIGSSLRVIKILDERAYIGDSKYVYAEYLSKSMPVLKTVISEDGLYVRKKRNFNNKKNPPIALLPKGSKVKVYKSSLFWSKVSPNKNAWVYSKYLK